MVKLETESIQEELRAAYSLAREGNYAEALGKLRDIRATLDLAGIRSGYIFWLAAISADGLGLISEAAEFIQRACEQDPVCPQFLNSRRIIDGRLDEAAAEFLTPVRRSWN